VDAQLTAFANQILDRHRPGEFNQAMMELGALICLPKSPRCPLCPLNSVCEANQRGIVEQLPIRNPRAAPRRLHGYLLLVKNVRGELWFTRGLPKPLPSNRQWQLPVVLDTQHLFTHLKRRGERHKPQVRHAITNNQLNLELLELEDPAVVNRLHGQGVWLAPRALNNRPLSALCLKGLRAGGCV
jgi:adenine-specific DNA glycosylase